MAPMRQQPRSNDRPNDARLVRPTTTHAALHRGLSSVKATLAERTRRHAILAETLQDSVIPNLFGSHSAGAHPTAPDAHQLSLGDAMAETALGRRVGPTSAEVETLVDLVLALDQQAAADYVANLHANGTAAESLYLDLLTPTARRLGVMWAEDECTFADVTIGMVRLQHVMRELVPAFLGPHFAEGVQPRPNAPRALLVQMPGEQHGMGLAMVVAFFRRAGWNVANDPVADSDELISLVRRQSYGIVGISVSCSERIEQLASAIAGIRRLSCNAGIGIMVGGPPFLEHPQLAEMVGADATAIDGRQAVQQAHLLIANRNAAR